MSESEKPAERPRFEINTGTDESHSASFEPGGEVALSTAKESVGVSFNSDGTTSRTDLVDDAELEAEVDASLTEGEEGGEDDKPDADEPAPEADSEDLPELPAFDPDNEETVAAYEKRYIKEDGEVNFEAFNKSFYASMAENPEKPDITADERAFVKKKLGVSDAAIDTYLGGVAQKSKDLDAAIHAEFGGKENLDAAIAWASQGGYTDAQKAKFNAALKAGGEDLKDQLDLLKARHGVAAPKAKAEPAPAKERRPSSPKASSTEATVGNGPSVEPYGSLAEYQRDMAAYSAKNDIKGMRDAEKRLAASKKLWKPGA